uniref:Uncharacterized protein n=1 Tax=Lepeophtheirus salmonis TaxID=72036 RepID=A0A0K2UEH8_LEPSM
MSAAYSSSNSTSPNPSLGRHEKRTTSVVSARPFAT